jgi:hypothetical protein
LLKSVRKREEVSERRKRNVLCGEMGGYITLTGSHNNKSTQFALAKNIRPANTTNRLYNAVQIQIIYLEGVKTTSACLHSWWRIFYLTNRGRYIETGKE